MNHACTVHIRWGIPAINGTIPILLGRSMQCGMSQMFHSLMGPAEG